MFCIAWVVELSWDYAACLPDASLMKKLSRSLLLVTQRRLIRKSETFTVETMTDSGWMATLLQAVSVK
jgi:hypothetical protein